MRHASWQRRAEDPTTPLPWIVWGDRHLPVARRWVLERSGLLALAAIVALGIAFGFSAVLLGTLVAWLGLAFYARPGAREHAALPDLGTESFPVTIELRYAGRRTGRENG